MSISVFNTSVKNSINDPMFLGNPVNTSRFDRNKYPFLVSLTELQNSFFWRPEEFNLTKDKTDFSKLKEHEKHIFDSNLKYQTLLDSVQGRAPILALLSIASLPELESWILAWSYFENNIHSKSYSHIIRNIYNRPDEILDGVIDNPEIIKRAQSIAQYQDRLINLVLKYDNTDNPSEKELMIPEIKRNILIFFFVVLMLEAVRFYISFSCSFAYAEGMKLMEGNAKIIKTIARDEAIHTTFSIHMLNILKSGKEGEDYKSYYQELIPTFKQIVQETYEQEKEWAKYLFKDGAIIGVNEQSSIQYLEYLIDFNITQVGLEPMFGSPKNPYPWIKYWFNSDAVQMTPQETEITSYTINPDAQVGDKDMDEMSDIDL